VALIFWTGTPDSNKACIAAILDRVTRVVHVPYVVDQDEDGGWRGTISRYAGIFDHLFAT
jgi:hypothetical protein